MHFRIVMIMIDSTEIPTFKHEILMISYSMHVNLFQTFTSDPEDSQYGLK